METASPLTALAQNGSDLLSEVKTEDCLQEVQSAAGASETKSADKVNNEEEESLTTNQDPGLECIISEGDNNNLTMVTKDVLNGSKIDTEGDEDSEGCGEAADDTEDYCNPMVSDSEEETGQEDLVLRGDRIGNTTYSERHVLKLLMKMVQELPKYSVSNSTEGDQDKEDVKLENDFEEEMSLLWDMSAEPDVMSYLVDKDIFTIIRDTLDVSKSTRLTEVALGITANLLSQKTIVEDFHVYDAKVKLVSKVIHLLSKESSVAVLIQIFAVLKRIVWYIKNVKIVDEWIALLIHEDFFQYANFIMASSTNMLLLGDVIITLYSLLEAICTDSVDREQTEGEDGSTPNVSRAEESASERSSRENCLPFCETSFVSSICEGLQELLKNPKPKVSKVEAFTGGAESNNEFEAEIPIPDGHVQTAILNGLSALTYMKNLSWTQHVLLEHNEELMRFLMVFLNKFLQCTDNQPNSNCVEYFALSLSLLEFCHKSLSTVSEEAIVVPISIAYQLILNERKNSEEIKGLVIRTKSGLDFDSVTYIALEMHNYLTAISEEFGNDCVADLRKIKVHRQFFSILDETVTKVCNANDNGTLSST